MMRAPHSLAPIQRLLSPWLLMAPCLLLFVLFVWMPLASGIVLSLFRTKGYDAIGAATLGNYMDVLTDPVFLTALRNSLVYVGLSLVIGFPLPIAVALVVNETRRARSFFRFSLFFPDMVPAVAAAIMWYFIFDPSPSGLINSLLVRVGLPPSGWLQDARLTIPLIVSTIVWRGLGSGVLIYLASLQSVNLEQYEVALLDGASVLQRIRHVALPHISGIVLIQFILIIIASFQILYEPMAMTGGGPNHASITLTLVSFDYAFRYFQAGKSMAASTLIFLMLMALTAVYFRLRRLVKVE